MWNRQHWRSNHKNVANQKSISFFVIESALEILKDAVMFSDKNGQMKRAIFDFEPLHESDRVESLQQKDITYFFKPACK